MNGFSEDASQEKYWASLQNYDHSGLNAEDWDNLLRRDSGEPTSAPEEITRWAGDDLIWNITGGWEEASIPRRPWVARGYALRSSITVVSGAGSAGKSSLMVAWSAAAALGIPFHRFDTGAPVRVATYNVEDDDAEQRRRYSAIFRHLGRTPYQTEGRLAILGPKRVGTLITRHPRQEDGPLVNTPVLDKIEDFFEEFRPDIAIFDPFVELHGMEENDNTAIRSVMARFRHMAARFNCAVIILHHSRKGASTPGDPDSLRGASAIVSAARVALTVSVMTEEEAEALGIFRDHRRNFFRLDGAKSNYAPIGDAEWFERVEFHLDNGDGVAAAVPFVPRKVSITPFLLDAIAQKIAEGTPNGLPWSDRLTGTEPRSIRHALSEAGITTEADQKSALQKLISTNRAEIGEFQRPGKSAKDLAKGLRTPGDHRPHTVTWRDTPETR